MADKKKTAKPTLPFVPPEGQPPAWYADPVKIALFLAMASAAVKRFGWQISEKLTGDLVVVLTFAGTYIIPAGLGFYGWMKERRRRKIVSGTLTTTSEMPAGVAPNLTASQAVKVYDCVKNGD